MCQSTRRSMLVVCCLSVLLQLGCRKTDSSRSSTAVLPTEENFIATNDGVRLFYRAVGRSQNLLVVLHGGPGQDMSYPSPDLDSLATTHKLVYYDQRGGGRSSVPVAESLLTIHHHVLDLETVRKHFGVDRCLWANARHPDWTRLGRTRDLRRSDHGA